MLTYKRYDVLWNRVFNHPDRINRAVAHIAVSTRAGRRYRSIRARANASAFECADYANLRKAIRNRASLILLRAAACSRAHDRLARQSLLAYGDHGPNISGCVREHFPTPVKDRLRRLASAASGSSFAYTLWRAAGGTLTTYRREHDKHSFGFYG